MIYMNSSASYWREQTDANIDVVHAPDPKGYVQCFFEAVF